MQRHFRYIFLLCFLTNYLLATGQTLPHRRYTTRDGLVADRITVITQDHNGFMWMGSLFGLSKYDGNKFTTIDLPVEQQHKYISTLLAHDKKLYAGFLFGGGIMEYEKAKILSYYIPGSGENDIVGLYTSRDGLLVVNSQNDVYLFRS